MGKIIIEGMHKVKKDSSGNALPEEFEKMQDFETYLCQIGDSLCIGIWDTSMTAKKYDSRGAFSDGIAGHFELGYVDALLLLQGYDSQYELSSEDGEKAVFSEIYFENDNTDE